jgi:hypothetical protein
MPLTPPGLIGPITANLVSTGHLGIATPQLAAGIAAGIMMWSPLVKVLTVDAGTLGVGAGVIPLVVPPPLLIAGLSAGFASFAMIGPIAPLTVIGLANGISLGMVQGQVITVHPGVGLGAGVCKFIAPPAAPMMIAGFASVGMVGFGAIQKASAIGMGLDIAFLSLVLPTPVAGPPSIVGGAGVGIGQIV